jgi:hypothetical protein
MSGQRLRARYMAGADNSKEFLGWHDSQRNEVCYFSTAGDGVTRCLPDGLPIGGFFLDAGCTQPLAYSNKGPCMTVYPYAKLYQPNDPVTCAPGGASVHHLGAQIGPQSIYTATSAGCEEVPPEAWTPSYDMYVVGAVIPPTQFVAGTYTIE